MAANRLREVIYEFVAIGDCMRVAAVDPDTLTEVTIVGPVGAGEATLRHAARRKLEYMLDKAAAPPPPAKPGRLV